MTTQSLGVDFYKSITANSRNNVISEDLSVGQIVRFWTKSRVGMGKVTQVLGG